MRFVHICIFILFNTSLFGQCINDTLHIGQDTTLCQGQSIQLSASSAYLTYDWSTGSTQSSINVSTTGQYHCTATIVDSTNLVINGDFSYGDYFFTSAYIYGTGGSWGLLSAEGQYAISTNANLTHNNFANCTDHTTGTGNYMIINGSSTTNQHIWCQTIATQPATDYIFSAWFTSVHSSNPAQLNFTINGTSIGPIVNVTSTTCQWQNFFQTWTSGATQTTANICITNQNTSVSGNDFGIDDIYFAQVCQFKDTVDIEVLDYPVVSLGSDTALCAGDSLYLSIVADSISTFLWQDSSTNQSYTAFNSDTLILEVANKHCKGLDSLVVDFYAYPLVDLGADTLICDGSALPLDATWPAASYLWNDGSSGSSLVASTTGTYWVNVNHHDCVESDSIHIEISNGPDPQLGPDQSFCMHDYVTLSPGTFDSYLWSTGSSLHNISVSPTTDQSYSVIVWDNLGCSDSTTINLSPIAIPLPLITSSADSLCLGETVHLTASGGDHYQWDDASTSDYIHLMPAEPSFYTVTVTNSDNGVDCSSDTSYFIFVEDCNTLFMPNAFSPNDDGLNETFGPEGQFALEDFSFYVFDRNGKIVFSTNNVYKKWDGKDLNGYPLPQGVYAYTLYVKEFLDKEYSLSGTVTLIR